MNSYDVPGGIKVSSDDENLSSWFRSSLVTIFSKLDLFCIISDKVKLNNVCLSSKDAVNGHAKLHTCGQKIARWRTPKLHGQLRDPKGIDVRVS